MFLFNNDPPESTNKQYKSLRSNSDFVNIRNHLESMWEKFKPYADSNFEIEIKHRFQDRFWEMYLGCYFLQNGFNLVRKGKNIGPDIIIDCGGKINIEATVPTNANGPNKINEPNLLKGTKVPHEKKILHYRSSIKDKFEKYNIYVSRENISINEPYIIAINAAELPSKYLDSFPHDIVKAVLPFGNEVAQINLTTQKVEKSYFEYRPNLLKENGKKVSTDIFMNEDYSGISGIIFSYVDAFSLPIENGLDFVFIHNPMTKNPLEKGWLKKGLEYWVEDNQLHYRNL